LLLGLREGIVRSHILEFVLSARHFVDVWQQGLVLVVEQLHRVFLDRAGEHESALRPPDQRQVEAERAVSQEVFLGRRVRPLQDLVAMGKPVEALDHGDVPVEHLVKHVERILRRHFGHRLVPLGHAQVLVGERLGVGQHQAEEDPLDRAQVRAHSGTQPALDQREAVRIAVVHPGRVAIHVAGELIQQQHQRHQQARVADIQCPVVVVTLRRQRHVGAKAFPDFLVGLLGLAEPQVQALLHVRPQHEFQDLLGLLHLRGRDLHAFELQQHAQIAPEVFGIRFREGLALVEAREDHLQRLLHALAQNLHRWLAVKHFCHWFLPGPPIGRDCITRNQAANCAIA
jgi:hypothetical protein